MKPKFFLPILAASLTFTSIKANATNYQAFTKEQVANMSDEEKQFRAEAIKDRVAEIKEMDKSTLSKEARKELKTELKSMRKEAREVRGVYISVGALIIIILLLIIIL
jgi:uncharacterized protein (DUF885 family)